MNYQTNYPQQQYNPQNMYKPVSYMQQQVLPQVRPVSSIEEVRASPIEFDGSIFYFPDNANKRIYTKFINLDGTVAINMYELKELSTDQPMSNNFVTRQEFDNVISQLRMMLENIPQPAPEVTPQPAAQSLRYEF